LQFRQPVFSFFRNSELAGFIYLTYFILTSDTAKIFCSRPAVREGAERLLCAKKRRSRRSMYARLCKWHGLSRYDFSPGIAQIGCFFCRIYDILFSLNK